MYIYVDENDWLEWRRCGCGGSDVAAILGLSKWASPLDIWEDKKGLRQAQSQNHAMTWGSRLETNIKEFWASKRDGLIPLSLHAEHDKYPILRASLDGWISHQEILEIKTARTSEGWGEEGTDEIPTAYMCQVQHYLNVVDAQICYVAVLIGGSDYREYTITRDQELIDNMTDFLLSWWDTHIVNDVPPAPRDYQEFSRRFSKSKPNEVFIGDSEIQVFEEYKKLQERKKELEQQEQALKLRIAEICGDSDTIKHGDKILCTFKSQSSSRIDTEALKKAYPELVNQFLKTSESRVLRIK